MTRQSALAAASASALLLVLGIGAATLAPDAIPVPEFELAPAWVEATARPGQPYDREAFEHWTDPDGNGCDTRNDILRISMTEVAADGCKVDRGVLVDPYTGQRIEFQRGPGTSNEVHIDHVVPLSWAWRHGADQWTPERREEFANDPANLVATDGPTNMAKGDSGPGDWMPPRIESHCSYLLMWRAVVNRYGLAMEDHDAAAVNAPSC